MVTYKNNSKFHLQKFFYDLMFFIIIALLMQNVLLGVLYDTFSELRSNLQDKENDIKNVCFICQLNRDDPLSKRIDFDAHINNEHFIWNYVYFMIYLHISNSNELDAIQNYVLRKINEQDLFWFPNCDDDK